MSAAGLGEEWARLLTVLAPDVADRLRLVVVLEEDVVVIPDELWLRDLADRSFEVMRVLLSRWLLHRGRIAVGELQRQTGLSHPSVSKGVAALGPGSPAAPRALAAGTSAWCRHRWGISGAARESGF